MRQTRTHVDSAFPTGFLSLAGTGRRIGLLGAINGYRIRHWFTDRKARDLGVRVDSTPTTSCETTREQFGDARADLALSLGNSDIAKSVFSMPRFGMIKVHMEMLPEFQGASSLIWPMFEGVRETGFTIRPADLTRASFSAWSATTLRCPPTQIIRTALRHDCPYGSSIQWWICCEPVAGFSR